MRAREARLTAFGQPPTIELRDATVAAAEDEVVARVVAIDLLPLDRQIAAGFFPPARVPVRPGQVGVVELVDPAGGLPAGAYAVDLGPRGGGSVRDGLMATEVAVPREALVPLPSHLEPLVAAAGLASGLSAEVISKDRGRVQAGETVLVIGATGGTGRATVSVCARLGANVIAASRIGEPVEGALGCPLDGLPTLVREMTDGHGADVIVDFLGAPTLADAIACGASRCRHLLVGFVASPAVELLLPSLLVREHQLIGVNVFASDPGVLRAAAQVALADLAAGRWTPAIASVLGLGDLPAAYEQPLAGRTLIAPNR